ncbi:MAG: SpoVR family protein [Desulfuromonadales bacterium]|nr:SpoVR family protein [Desulfuromonadales bacterium]
MELIDQHTKKIMEGCKERARSAGLRFEDETLEYIVTNRDLLELTPKLMIPTLYDYWVHDVEVLREKGRYELYPGNPYETVINTRPAISFYNDNNPDWLNVMIFYHVLAHIDFFQNNSFFRHTWEYDLNGQALSDKRMIAGLRARHGRWVDYVLEFGRSLDNLVGYFGELARIDRPPKDQAARRLDFYFDVFLQTIRKVKIGDYVKEINRYNEAMREGEGGERAFFADAALKYPEFEAIFEKQQEEKPPRRSDLLEFLIEHSPLLNRNENKWMKAVLQVVRNTSIYFQPQIRTKIMNEGWASYWHEKLFLQDERIRGHEVDFARVHASVASLPRVGLNPYGLGMRLFEAIEENAERGRYSAAYQRLADTAGREDYDARTGQGQAAIFQVRENMADFLFLSRYVDQDFVSRNRLFVAGRRLNQQRMVWEYYVKSRKADDYRQMLLDSLYHPPHIDIEATAASGRPLPLQHRFEGKPLVRDYIANTMLGIEYLWGAPVQLETQEAIEGRGRETAGAEEIKWQRVKYEMKERQLSRTVLG